MHNLERIKKTIEKIVALSSVSEDSIHSRNTLQWLLRLKSDADEGLQIAALGHDIERAIEERKVKRRDFEDYDVFKEAHARNSANILRELMLDNGITDPELVDDVYMLVCRHEVGGDPRSDILKDADSLSYFDVNLPHYYQRNGREETLRRCCWGYRRLSEHGKTMLREIRHDDEALRELLKIVKKEGDDLCCDVSGSEVSLR